jgi:hypothetical protein
MSEVCVDSAGGGTWRFEPDTKQYVRSLHDGTVTATIAGQFLPDPDALWGNRLKLYGVPAGSEMGERLKPQPATYALWQHWKGRDDAQPIT